MIALTAVPRSKKTIASFLAAALGLSPGLAGREALAATAKGQSAGTPVAVGAVPVAGAASVTLPALAPGLQTGFGTGVGLGAIEAPGIGIEAARPETIGSAAVQAQGASIGTVKAAEAAVQGAAPGKTAAEASAAAAPAAKAVAAVAAQESVTTLAAQGAKGEEGDLGASFSASAKLFDRSGASADASSAVSGKAGSGASRLSRIRGRAAAAGLAVAAAPATALAQAGETSSGSAETLIPAAIIAGAGLVTAFVTGRFLKKVAATLDNVPTNEEIHAYRKAQEIRQLASIPGNSMGDFRLPTPGVEKVVKDEIRRISGKDPQVAVADAEYTVGAFDARYAAYNHRWTAAIVRRFGKGSDGGSSSGGSSTGSSGAGDRQAGLEKEARGIRMFLMAAGHRDMIGVDPVYINERSQRLSEIEAELAAASAATAAPAVPKETAERYSALKKEARGIQYLLMAAGHRDMIGVDPVYLNERSNRLVQIDAELQALERENPGLVKRLSPAAKWTIAGFSYIALTSLMALVSTGAAAVTGVVGAIALAVGLNVYLMMNASPEAQKRMGEMAKNLSDIR